MADGFEMLVAEHRAIERDFETYRYDEETSVVRELCEHITRHIRVEQAALHPALRRLVDGGDDLADRAQSEEAAVAAMIAEIYDAAMPKRIPTLVAQLRRAVNAHFEEEESEMFPAMRSCGVDSRQLASDLASGDQDASRTV